MLINSQIVLMPFLVSFISLLNMYIEEEIIQSEKKEMCRVSNEFLSSSAGWLRPTHQKIARDTPHPSAIFA